MTMDFNNIYFISLLFIHLVFLLVILYNFFSSTRLTEINYPNTNEVYLSVLIPARNEDTNIRVCLNSLINSTYKNLEIIVLDDASTDQTFSVVSEFKNKYSEIDLITGKPLPSDWFGKNWACFQLAQKAKGELLLFLDADVQITNQALSYAVQTFLDKKVKMLSVFPTQIIKSFGEWLVVPLMDWLLLTFLPLKKIYTSRKSSLAAANGQFMLFEREMYFKLGGHQPVRHKIVEDMAFVKIFKSEGVKVITLLGNDLIKCRMYNNLSNAVSGYTKNFYPGFNVSSPTFIFLLIFSFLIFVSPIVIAFYESIMLIILAIILIQIIFISMLSRQNMFLKILLFTPQLFLLLFIGINSVIAFKIKSVVWKDRIIK
jgi:chlorobactene glucosyltransferase